MAERLLAELPAGFRVHTTPHYVVCYNTSRTYAQWTSSLLERLYKAFTNYWENQGFELREPEFPLPVLVFNDRETYDRFSRDELPGGRGQHCRLLQSPLEPREYVRSHRRRSDCAAQAAIEARCARSSRCSHIPRQFRWWPRSSTRRRIRSRSIAACKLAMRISRCGCAKEWPCTSRRPIWRARAAGGESAA